MIVHRKEKSPYFEQTIESLNGKSYFTVENSHRDQFPDSRVESYSLGTSEYVSFVDDDDLLYDVWRLWSSSAQEHSSKRCRPWDLLKVYKQKFESRFPEFKR